MRPRGESTDLGPLLCPVVLTVRRPHGHQPLSLRRALRLPHLLQQPSRDAGNWSVVLRIRGVGVQFKLSLS